MKTGYVITVIDMETGGERLITRLFSDHDDAINAAQEIAIREGAITKVLLVNLDPEARFGHEGGRL